MMLKKDCTYCIYNVKKLFCNRFKSDRWRSGLILCFLARGEDCADYEGKQDGATGT